MSRGPRLFTLLDWSPKSHPVHALHNPPSAISTETSDGVVGGPRSCCTVNKSEHQTNPKRLTRLQIPLSDETESSTDNDSFACSVQSPTLDNAPYNPYPLGFHATNGSPNPLNPDYP
ncbi:hypothetical protein U1Q18_034773 [Sarracenia purpurea var. burkii]